jgi:hypothetical protein
VITRKPVPAWCGHCKRRLPPSEARMMIEGRWTCPGCAYAIEIGPPPLLAVAEASPHDTEALELFSRDEYLRRPSPR